MSTTDAYSIQALNEYTWHQAPEAGLVAELVASMEANGWQGDPVLVHEGQAVTGTHRIAAAREAGIKVEVLDLADVIDNAAERVAEIMTEGWDSVEAVAALFALALGDGAMGNDTEYASLLADLQEQAA